MAKKLSALCLGVLFAVTCIRVPDGAVEDGFELRATRSGNEVRLRLVNRSSSAALYNLCTSGLQRQSGSAWAAVETGTFCTMELRRLDPGAAAEFPHVPPRNLPAGVYRYVNSIETPPGGGRLTVASNSFNWP